MEMAKAAINNGFKASDWTLDSGSLRFVSTVLIRVVDCTSSGHCEVTISPDIFRDLKLLHNMRYLTATLKHALYFAVISN